MQLKGLNFQNIQQLIQLKTKPESPFEKWADDLNRHFSREDIQMTNRHMKRYSSSLRLLATPQTAAHQAPPSMGFSRQEYWSGVPLLSCVQLLATPWTAACQDSLSITNSQTLLKLMHIESVMPSKPFILCCPLLLLPSIFPNIRDFSNESALHMKWPKYEFQLQHESFQWTPRTDFL